MRSDERGEAGKEVWIGCVVCGCGLGYGDEEEEEMEVSVLWEEVRVEGERGGGGSTDGRKRRKH